jgi:hypothetical protein
MKLTIICLLAALTSPQCPDNDTLCSKCDGNICRACIRSYPDSFGKCIEIPALKVPNCYYYFSSGKCLICEKGYRRNEKFKCKKIEVENCDEVDVNDSCSVCSNGIRAVVNICPPSNRCATKNCSRCNAKNICVECLQGFYRDSQGLCQPEKDLTANCLHVDSFGNCVICRPDYYDNNSVCTSINQSEIFRILWSVVLSIALWL